MAAAVARGRAWELPPGERWVEERRRRGSWSSMDGLELTALTTLGWTAQLWDEGIGPSSEIAWESMEPRQRAHASYLGLTKQTWASLWDYSSTTSSDSSEDEGAAPVTDTAQSIPDCPPCTTDWGTPDLGMSPDDSEALRVFLAGMDLVSRLVPHASCYFELLRDNMIDLAAIAVAEVADWSELGIPVEDGQQLSAAAQLLCPVAAPAEFAAQVIMEEEALLAAEQQAASLALAEQLQKEENDAWARSLKDERDPSEPSNHPGSGASSYKSEGALDQWILRHNQSQTTLGEAAAASAPVGSGNTGEEWKPVQPQLSKKQRKRKAAKARAAAQHTKQAEATVTSATVEEAFDSLSSRPSPNCGRQGPWSMEVKLIEVSDCALVEGPNEMNIRAAKAIASDGSVTITVDQTKLLVTIEAAEKDTLERVVGMLSLTIVLVPVQKKVLEAMLSTDAELDGSCRMTAARADELWIMTGAKVSWQRPTKGGKQKGNGRRKGAGASATAYQFTVQGVESNVKACVEWLNEFVSGAQKALDRRNALIAEQAVEAKAAKELAARQAAEEQAARERKEAEERAARERKEAEERAAHEKAQAKKKKRERQAAKKKQDAREAADRQARIDRLAKERAAAALERQERMLDEVDALIAADQPHKGLQRLTEVIQMDREMFPVPEHVSDRICELKDAAHKCQSRLDAEATAKKAEAEAEQREEREQARARRERVLQQVQAGAGADAGSSGISASDLRETGNDAFKDGGWVEAEELYTMALQVTATGTADEAEDERAKLLSNRSAALGAQEMWLAALADALEVCVSLCVYVCLCVSLCLRVCLCLCSLCQAAVLSPAYAKAALRCGTYSVQ